MKVQVLVLLLHAAGSCTYVAGVNYLSDNADFQTFLVKLIDHFTAVGRFKPNKRQFAVVVMVSQQELTDWDVHYQPSDDQGFPLIDVNKALSPPCNQDHFVNFIVARPNNTVHGTVHSEQQILPRLPQLLQCFRKENEGQDPAAIILYSRICPCRVCTDSIVQSFDNLNLPAEVILAVIFSTDGPNVRNVNRDYTYQQLISHSFQFFRYPPKQDCNNMGSSNAERNLYDQKQVSDCRPLQRYLLDQLGNTLECCVSSAQPKRATADLINRLMANCMSELHQLDSCLGKAAKKFLGGYCSCSNGFATAAQLSKYVKQAMHSSPRNLDLHFISHPLDPNNPTHITGPITEREQLQSYDDSVTYSCNDNRHEGLMCSSLKSNYLTAGRSICREDSPCGKHDGYSYSWCYLEATGWDYCCTEICRQEGRCSSGSSWQYCTGDIGYVTAGNTVCKTDSPCGLHGEEYTWCHTDYGWEYCCTDDCSYQGENYQWCNAGSEWEYCTGDIGYVTAGNTVCKTDSPCGLHDEEYTWCYTDYGWEYCCTDDCSYQGENYQWCNAGSEWEYCGQYDNGKGWSTVTSSYCLPSHQCGKHGEYPYENWCYTNSQKDWDYCCAPGNTCSSRSGSDLWCYTGENSSTWQYCNKISHDELRKRNEEKQTS